MRTICQRKLLIWATLSLLLVLMVGSKTFAANSKLLASDGAADNQFGSSVSISGNVAVVGAPVNIYDSAYSGSAYVFRWNGSVWVEEQKLVPSDGAAGDSFGLSVFISGDVVMVGAPNHDEKGTNSGAVYVFRRNGSTWVEKQKLLASDGSEYDYFGFSVFISGDLALVGAPLSSSYSGAAYVFRWNGSTGDEETWVEKQRLLASDASRGDFVGFSVSISGNVALMGAPNHSEGNAVASGAAYVFRWNGSTGDEETWVEEQKLLASDGAYQDQLGTSVSISGDMALVGAPLRSSYSGAVYVFRWDGSTWVEEQKLLASDGSEGDCFGMTVSISGDVALVGALGDYNNNGLRSGSAYILRWNGTAWEEKQKLLAPDGAFNDQFGSSVSISGDVALVGAPYDDDEDQGTDSGSVYVYYVYNDYDSDGISNSVDSDPSTPSVLFSDVALGGATSGQIMSLDPGITIEISDAPNSTEGVRVLVLDLGSTGGVASIRIDGSQGTYQLSAGEYILTSGSTIVRVVEGQAVIEFTIGGETVLVVVGVEGTAVIHETIVGGELQGLVVEAVYGSVTVNGVVVEPGESITHVSIDIKPGTFPNSINLRKEGAIPVAILGSETFDATTVDPTTVRFGATGIKAAPVHAALQDVNGDGKLDMILHFNAKATGLVCGDTSASLIGQIYGGDSIEGHDSIVTVGCK